ncbi:hypothetical protein DFH09DRAFT_1440762, partial [Mycena vulgaris]
MRLIFAVTAAASLLLPSWAATVKAAPVNVTVVCQQIAQKVSNASAVFYPGSSEYAADIFHDSVSSSTQESVCSVEPGTAQDVSHILQLVGSTRTPFAVKGGGHAWNPGFSSTTGVQIDMSRFNSVAYSKTNAPNGVVTFGAGMLWDHIYAALDPLNITVVGGRVVGVGAAGFLLGGGYSFFSNQYGMAVDNILAFDIVKPGGTECTVTASSDPDLFWALKARLMLLSDSGGLNNFGIVTAFTMRAIPYTRVWVRCGALVAHVNEAEAYKAAFEVFNSKSKDPKAAMLFGLNGINGTSLQFAVMFYDGPQQPAGIYDGFLNIPGAVINNNGTFTMGGLLAAVNIAGLAGGSGVQPRYVSGVVHIETYTPEIIDTTPQKTKINNALLANASSAGFGFSIEPFSPGYLTAPARTSDSAFPPTWTRPYSAAICNLGFQWVSATNDAANLAAMQGSVDRIQAAETKQSRRTLPRYSNLALADTPLDQLFGPANVARLTAIANRVDPLKVMQLAGGFKV